MKKLTIAILIAVVLFMVSCTKESTTKQNDETIFVKIDAVTNDNVVIATSSTIIVK